MGAVVHERQEVVINGISSLDEPSVEWGWHQRFPKSALVVGVFFVLFLLAMLYGPHEGNVENLWVLTFAAGISYAMFVALRKQDPKVKAEKQSQVWEVPDDHYTRL